MLSKSLKKSKHVLNIAIFGLMLAAFPMMAQAAPGDGIATSVLTFFTGGLVRTIAIICVILCGLAAMAGKLRQDWAFSIIVGIFFVFGSAAIVDYFSSSAGDGGDA